MIEALTAAGSGVARVCVAVPTYRRSAQLTRLLVALAAQAPPPGYAVEVLVVDNDTRPSARELVEAEIENFAFPLRYAHCAEPGLSSVRNFALTYARDRCDLLVMLDDDECPEPQWLAELLRVARATGADAVVGPVPQRLPAAAPRWLRAGKFYDLPTPGDGTRIRFGYSGNCLLRVTSLARFGVTFDPQLNFAGGEDLLFFRELLARGATFAYAARAIANEEVAPERLRAAYVIRLNFRRGNTLALCDRRLGGSARALSLRALKGCARVFLGFATAVPRAALQGRAGAMRAGCDVAHGLGALAGLLGYVYQAYERGDVARR